MSEGPGRAPRRAPFDVVAGFQLLEVGVVIVVAALALGAAAVPFHHWSSQVRLRSAASELVSVLRRARTAALAQGCKVGVKFRHDRGERVRFTLYRDNDGDGVLTRDIERGIDTPLGLESMLRHVGGDVRLGFPVDVDPTDPGSPGRRLGRLDDPIRFNRSDIATFNPLGQATPGSLYVTDGRHLLAVRVYGGSGRVRLLRWERESETWNPI